MTEMSFRLPEVWARAVAARVARTIRNACGQEADKNADVADQIDDACDAAVSATLQVLAEEFNGHDRLHDDTALATAVARAKREALEKAAKVAADRVSRNRMDYGVGSTRADEGLIIMDAIRSLAATPPEDRQTETEADNLRIAMRMFMDSGHGGAMATVRQWFSAGGIGPVPDPEGACFWAWAKDNGLSNVGGFVRANPPPAIGNLEGEGR